MKIICAVWALLLCGIVQAKQPTFYMITHAGPGDPYWSRIAQGAEDAGKKLGVRVLFAAPEKPGQVAKQVEILASAISARPDGIVTTIPDAKPFQPLIQRAVKAKIPTLAFDTREETRDPVGLPYSAYIGTDEYHSGKQVGNRAVEAFNLRSGDLTVVAIHQPGVISLELRKRGIKEALSSKGIDVLPLDITSNPSKATGIIQSFMRSHPKTKVIFTLGPLGLVPAGKYLMERQGRDQQNEKIHLVGFDVDPVGLDLLKKGILDFTVDSQPYLQAFLSVTQLYLVTKFHTAPVDIDTGITFLDQTQIDRCSQLLEGRP